MGRFALSPSQFPLALCILGVESWRRAVWLLTDRATRAEERDNIMAVEQSLVLLFAVVFGSSFLDHCR